MANFGSFSKSGTAYFWFNTLAQTGEPDTLGSGAVAAYEDGSDTEIVGAEVALSVDVDTVTGLNRVAVDLTDADFEDGKNYTLVLTAGTVDSISVAGRIIGSFQVVDAGILDPVETLFVDLGGVPKKFITPTVSTDTFVFGYRVLDQNNETIAPDSLPTLTLVDEDGTDLVSRLTAHSALSAGVFTVTYTATAADADAQLTFGVSAVKSGYTGGEGEETISLEHTSAPQSGDSFARLGAPDGDDFSQVLDGITDSITNNGQAIAGVATDTADAKTAAESVDTKLTTDRAAKLDRDLAHAADADTYKASGFSTQLDVTAARDQILTAVDEVDADVDPQTVRDAMKLAPTAGAPAPGSIDDLISDIESGGGIVIPVNQVPVPQQRRWTLKQSGSGLVGEAPLVRFAGEDQLFAVDFTNDLASNGRLVSIDMIEIASGPVGGIIVSEEESGVDRADAKMKINLVDEGEYTIVLAVTYDDSDGGGTSVGAVTLIVRPSLIP